MAFQAPLGYLNRRAGGTSSLIRDSERAPLIQKAFESFATGRFTKSEILRRTTALGLRTQRGKELSAQTLNALLRNPIYTGWVRIPSWNLEARGEFEALVSEQVFRRVQAVLNGRTATLTPHMRNHPDFPLSALRRLPGMVHTPNRELVEGTRAALRVLPLPYVPNGEGLQRSSGNEVHCARSMVTLGAVLPTLMRSNTFINQVPRLSTSESVIRTLPIGWSFDSFLRN